MRHSHADLTSASVAPRSDGGAPASRSSFPTMHLTPADFIHTSRETLLALASLLERRFASQSTTVALYDGLLARLTTTGGWASAPPRALLESFRRDAERHLGMVRYALQAARVQMPEQELSDPTGSLRVLSNENVTMSQCIHALVSAQIASGEDWATLIQLANELGQRYLAAAFQQASVEEQQHWQELSGWLCDSSP